VDRVKIGVIGVGHLGRIHTRVYSELSEKVELVGIYDQNAQQAETVAREYQTRAYSSPESLLEQCSAVSCAVPTSSHYEIGRLAATAGCHALIEKPITDQIETAESLVSLFRTNGLNLMVGHTERFNPAMEVMRHLTLKPKFIEGHRLAPFNPRGTDVAVIYDLMIHDIDIILKIMGSEPESIDSAGVSVITPHIDIANVRMKFSGGCVVNLTTSRISQKKMRKLRLFQENSYISIDFLEKYTKVISLNAQAIDRKDTLYTEGFSLTDFNMKQYTLDREPLKAELSEFVDSILQHREPAVNGEDGLKALRICRTIEDKIQENLKEMG